MNFKYLYINNIIIVPIIFIIWFWSSYYIYNSSKLTENISIKTETKQIIPKEINIAEKQWNSINDYNLWKTKNHSFINDLIPDLTTKYTLKIPNNWLLDDTDINTPKELRKAWIELNNEWEKIYIQYSYINPVYEKDIKDKSDWENILDNWMIEINNQILYWYSTSYKKISENWTEKYFYNITYTLDVGTILYIDFNISWENESKLKNTYYSNLWLIKLIMNSLEIEETKKDLN